MTSFNIGFKIPNFVFWKDAEGQNRWLTSGLLSCFAVMVYTITSNLGQIPFAIFAVVTLTLYTFITSDATRRRIWLSCVIITLGLSFIRLYDSPIDTEHCKIKSIRLPSQFVNASTHTDLTFHVCVKYRHCFSDYACKVNPESNSSTQYVTPNVLASIVKSPMHRLDNYLKDPQIIGGVNKFLEGRFDKWLQWALVEDMTDKRSSKAHVIDKTKSPEHSDPKTLITVVRNGEAG